MTPALHGAQRVVSCARLAGEVSRQVKGLIEQFGDLVWNLGGLIQFPDGFELLNPLYIPEWSRFAEADAAAVSLSDWNGRNGGKPVALYDTAA